MDAFKPFKIGKFLLMERIATGGMAEVYRGKASGAGGFEKPVAVKRIIPSYSQNEEFRRMFEYEARLSSMLTHANIVQVYDFVKSGDTYMLSMEYVDGKNLRQIINKTKKLNTEISIEAGVWIINEVCKGLDYAHKKHDDILNRPLNIIHRDMSPQNIMISYEGAVKIVDFGIAKAKDRVDETRSGVIKGKFGYMSPEQASGEDVDHRTDIFSTGIIFFELITGKRLFAADNDMQTLKRIQECIIQRPTLANPKISIELEKILLKALAKDRELRFQTAGQLQQKLQEYINKHFPSFNQQTIETMITGTFTQERALEQKRFTQAYRQSIPFSQGQQDDDIGEVKANLEGEPQTKSEKGPNTFVTQGEDYGDEEVGTAGPEVNEVSNQDGTQGDDDDVPRIKADLSGEISATIGGEEEVDIKSQGTVGAESPASQSFKLDEPSYQSLSKHDLDGDPNTNGTLGYEIEGVDSLESTGASIKPVPIDDEIEASVPNINLDEISQGGIKINVNAQEAPENTQSGKAGTASQTMGGRTPSPATQVGVPETQNPGGEIDLESALEEEISFITQNPGRGQQQIQQTQQPNPQTNASQVSIRLQTQDAESATRHNTNTFSNVRQSPDANFSIEDRTPSSITDRGSVFEPLPQGPTEDATRPIRLLLSLVLFMVFVALGVYLYLGTPPRDLTGTNTGTQTGVNTEPVTGTQTTTQIEVTPLTSTSTEIIPKGNCVLNVDVDPSPAAITIDGKKRGNVPTALAIPCGRPVTVVISRGGFAELTRTVTVGATEKEQELYVTLKKIPSGKLQLNISHRAKVLIDDVPADDEAIPGQNYELVLKANKKYKLRFLNPELKIDETREYFIKENTIKVDRIILDAK